MTVIGVTGGSGFLGWHVRTRLRAMGIESLASSRATFEDDALLDAFVAKCDLIVHAAGVNRAATEHEVEEGNVGLASSLAGALTRAGSPVPVAFANSVQAYGSGAYGQSKAAASAILRQACQHAGVDYLDLVLPHLFGEFGRPNYNSAVATFSDALARGSEPTIDSGGQLELLHAQDVAVRIAQWASSPSTAEERVAGHRVTVGDVWDLLNRQHRRYRESRTVPSFENRFELRVFNMLRSHLYGADFYPFPLQVHADQRGGFFELCRSDGTGQTSVSTSGQAVRRGDHFHFDKIERFVVVEGEAVIKIRRVLTGELREYPVRGDEPVVIDMPTLCTHSIENVGTTTLTTVFWAGDLFDPKNPDTYAEPVEVLGT